MKVPELGRAWGSRGIPSEPGAWGQLLSGSGGCVEGRVLKCSRSSRRLPFTKGRPHDNLLCLKRSREGRETGQKPRPFGAPGCVQGSPGHCRPAQAQPWASTSTSTPLGTRSALKLSIQDSQCMSRGARARGWDPARTQSKDPQPDTLWLPAVGPPRLAGFGTPCSLDSTAVPSARTGELTSDWRVVQRAYLLGTEFSRQGAFSVEGQEVQGEARPG